MGDMTVILDRKELVVRMESSTLRIDSPGARPQRIPLNMVDRVIAIGNPMVSCGVWRELAERNIPAVLLPGRGKGGVAYLGAGLSANVPRRVAQYRAVFDKDLSLRISRWILLKKINRQETVIRDMCGSGTPGKFRRIIEKCKHDIGSADTREAMMGHEGIAAAAYFGTLAGVFPRKWGFSGRNRRPPKDPVNALLSLSYVIAGSEILREIREKGLDPTLGFLHSPRFGRENLVLDILEPLRPLTDRFVLRLLDTVISPEDFTISEKDGCRLIKKGRRAYYDAWAAWAEDRETQNNLWSDLKEIIRDLNAFF